MVWSLVGCCHRNHWVHSILIRGVSPNDKGGELGVKEEGRGSGCGGVGRRKVEEWVWRCGKEDGRGSECEGVGRRMVEEWVWRCGKEDGRGVGVEVWEGGR